MGTEGPVDGFDMGQPGGGDLGHHVRVVGPVRPSPERAQETVELELDDGEESAGLERGVEAGVHGRGVRKVVVDAAQVDGVAAFRGEVRLALAGLGHGDVVEAGVGDGGPDGVAAVRRQLGGEHPAGLADHGGHLDAQPPVAGADVGHRVAGLEVEHAGKAFDLGLVVPAGEDEKQDQDSGAAQPEGELSSFHRAVLVTLIASAEFRASLSSRKRDSNRVTTQACSRAAAAPPAVARSQA